MYLKRIGEIHFCEMRYSRSHGWKEMGNKYCHGLRVATLAVKLRRYILPDDSSGDEILTVAGWFHDICNGMNDHACMGAKRTYELLNGVCNADELNEICGIIAVHDDRCKNKYSTLTRILQDADLLDHFGTYDIVMSLAYTFHTEQTIPELADYLVNERPKEDEGYLAKINFDISRRIYNEKCKFLHDFSERFKIESEGGIWNEAIITAGSESDK